MTDKLIRSWHPHEEDMYEEHYPIWLRMIEQMNEPALDDLTVLDFGCNQGGFLRVLYEHKPFQQGIGVDLATEPIVIANNTKGTLPLIYEATDTIGHLQGQVDVAFSHEVIYLVEDLPRHAAEMYAALKPGCGYYAAVGCHTDNPLWSKWRDLIAPDSALPVQDYSLDHIARTFQSAGFRPMAQKMMLNHFLDLELNSQYFPTVMDAMNYWSDWKILFKFVKP